MNNKYFSIAKTIVILGISYIFTMGVMFSFFPNNSPQINTLNVQYLARTIKEGPSQFLSLLNQKNQPSSGAQNIDIQSINTNNMISFEAVSKGIYAKEENGDVVTVVKQDEIESIQHSFVVDGKQIEIRVPVNGVSKEEIQKMLNESKTYKKAN